MAKKAGNNYPYLLVEEGLKKNHSSDRLRSYVSGKVAKRAQIELSYIRELQEWVDDLRPLTDCSSNCYLDTEITRRILSSLKQEALAVIEARQKVYNDLMSENGPYTQLQRPDCMEILSKLTDIGEEFATMNHKRREIEQIYRRHQERREHARHQIEALESQLSQRSRLVTSRRPSTRNGHRKVDEMQEKLSKLRQQNETETEKADYYASQLTVMDAETEQPLTTLDSDLEKLELSRIHLITEQVRRFLDIIQSLHSFTGKTKNENRGTQNVLDTIESLLKVHWVDVRANARRAERGELTKYTDLFEVNALKKSGSRTKASLARPTPVTTPRTDSPDPGTPRPGTRNSANTRTPGLAMKGAELTKNCTMTKGLGRENRDINRKLLRVTPQGGNERLSELMPTESILTHLSCHKSGSESSLDGSNPQTLDMSPRNADLGQGNAGSSPRNIREDCRGSSSYSSLTNVIRAGADDRYNRVYNTWRPGNGPSWLPVAKASKSNESIETLELPPEVICPAEITRIDPNRQYTTRMKLAKTLVESGPTSAHVTEYSSITKFTAEETDSAEDISSGSDVSNLVNIRVVAIQDSHPAPGTNELPFRAGQMIKQKRGADAYGMCYGWTREGRLGKKIHGFYKPHLVRPAKNGKL